MRCSLEGLASNAADCIKQLAERLKELMPRGFEKLEEELQPAYYQAALLELARHATDTAAGKHTVEEFADVYCLREEQK